MKKKINHRIGIDYTDFSCTQINLNDGCVDEFTTKNWHDFAKYAKSLTKPVEIKAHYQKHYIDLWQGRGDKDSLHPIIHTVNKNLGFVIVSNKNEFNSVFANPDTKYDGLVVNRKLHIILPKSTDTVDYGIWAFFNKIDIPTRNGR